MRYCVENSADSKSAFLSLAENYKAAAEICRKMAGIASESELDIDADTHMICVGASPAVIQKLLDDNMAYVIDDDDDYDDEDDDDEDYDEEY